MVDRPVALLLPGQGSQFQGMAVPLYGREPVFTETLDEFFDLMGSRGSRLRDNWLSTSPRVPVDKGTVAQPMLFAIDYAIARTLAAYGVRASVLVGHSVGELAAAALAGVYDLAAAARILAARCAALAAAPAGGMTAVAAVPERVQSHLDPAWVEAGVVVGAVNAPQQTVLAGPEKELAAAEHALRAAGLITLRVRALEPFHSPVMAAAADQFERALAREVLRSPTVEIRSGRTGCVVRPQEAVQPSFWARQMAEPVLFWAALSGLLDTHAFTLVEAGPGRALSAAARRHPSVRAGRSEVVTLLPGRRGDGWSEWRAGLDRLRELVSDRISSCGRVLVEQRPAGRT